MMDENGYNRLRNKEYPANVEQRANEQDKQDAEIFNMTNNSLDSEIKDVQSKILPTNKDMTEEFPKFAESQFSKPNFENLRRKSIATIEKLNSLTPQ